MSTAIIAASSDLLEEDKIKSILSSDSSFVLLSQRLKSSIKACDEFVNFITRKCHSELKYSKDLSRTVTHCDHSILANNIIVSGSFIQSLQKVIQFDSKITSVRDPYITALQTMLTQLESLSHHFTNLRKQLKEKGNRAEKEVMDSINLAKKARNRYWNLCSDLEKVRNQDRTQTKITLQGRKTNSQQEVDLKVKIKDAEDDYNKKANASQRLKNILVNNHRPAIANEFKNLIIELDYAMQIQLQKYSIYTESLIVGMGNQINPINGSDSMKKIATNVDLEKCLYFYLKGSTIRTNENLEPVDFVRHPIVGGALPNSATKQNPKPKPKLRDFSNSSNISSSPNNTSSLNSTNPTFTNSTMSNKSTNIPTVSKATTSSNIPSSNAPSSTTFIPPIPTLGNSSSTSLPTYGTLDPNSPILNGPRPFESDHNGSTTSFTDNSINFSHSNLSNSYINDEINTEDYNSHGKLFGLPLETLELDDEAVPLFVKKCINIIETYGENFEGIYRLSPNKTNLDELKTQIDSNPHDLSLLDPADGTNITSDYIYTISTLLKRFFASLPDPLLTNEQRHLYLQAAELSDKSERQTKIHQLIFELPDSNYFTLRDLLGHFRNLTEMPRVRMDGKNIAIVWANNLLGGDFESREELGLQQRVVEDLIEFAPSIFTYAE